MSRMPLRHRLALRFVGWWYRFKRATGIFFASGPLTALMAGLILASVVVGLTVGHALSVHKRPYSTDFVEGILVEAHGSLLDVFIVGVFILWLDEQRRRRVDRKEYLWEIDSLRGSVDEYVSFQNARCVRRLSEIGEDRINLKDSFLARSQLEGVKMRHALLMSSIFSEAQLYFAKLTGANLSRAAFTDAKMDYCDLRDTHIDLTDFKGASLKFAILGGANIISANFDGADLTGANLIGCRVPAQILLGAKGLETARMSDELRDALVEESVLRTRTQG